MCTINMTFDVPDTQSMDIEALKQKINAFVQQLIANPGKELTKAEELEAQEEKEAFLYTSRMNASKMFAKYL